MSTKADVVVLGGGPAGCAAAIDLARQGCEVLLIERSDGLVPRLPETHVPLPEALVSRLDISQALRESLMPPKPIALRTSFDAGGVTLRLEPDSDHPTCLSVDRTQLDAGLLARASAAGARVLRRAVVRDVIQSDNTVIGVRVEHDGGLHEYHALTVIDGTGKAGLLRQTLQLATRTRELDQRAALFSHFEGDAIEDLLGSNGMVLSTSANGYILLARLGNRVSVISTMHDLADTDSTVPVADRYFASLAQWPQLTSALQASKQVLPVIAAMNHMVECERMAGAGYLLVGDAGAFSDPFFCPGLRFALESGVLAADAVASWLLGGGARLEIEDYHEQCIALLHARRAWTTTQLTQGAIGQLARTLADPHLPWAIPAALLGLLAGRGAPWAPETARDPVQMMNEARRLYTSA